MTININTDIDTQIKQLDEMLEKIKQLEDKSLPVEDYGKQKVVELNALINWYQQRRSRKN